MVSYITPGPRSWLAAMSFRYRKLMIGQIEPDNFHLSRPVEYGDRHELLGQDAYSSERQTGYQREKQNEAGQKKNIENEVGDVVPVSWNVFVPRHIALVVDVLQ